MKIKKGEKIRKGEELRIKKKGEKNIIFKVRKNENEIKYKTFP